jgi:hypothetical protein
VKIKTDMVVAVSAAEDAEDQIFVDGNEGHHVYDNDGPTSAAQVKIATLTKAKLTGHHFSVI